MEKLDPFTLNLLTNDEVIAVNQDALGKQATCQVKKGDLRVYVKELEDGSRAVGFCNFGLEPVDVPFSDFQQLGLKGKLKVRDLWRQKDIAKLDTSKDKLPVKVPAHGVFLVKIDSIK